MADIERIVRSIEKGNDSKAQLLGLYERATEDREISEEDRELLVIAIEKQLKVRFPAAAKKQFGAKDEKAREILFKIYNQVNEEFDFSNNKLKNGVKTGGGMISGRCYIQVYLSYKNADNFGAYLTLQQDGMDDELRAIVGRYKTGGGKSETLGETNLGLDQLSEIGSIYREHLIEVSN